MRTTIDLPDEMYRSLKARAALGGTTLRSLIRTLIEQGLRQTPGGTTRTLRREPPPVIIPRRGIPIEAVPRADVHRFEEAEDEEKYSLTPASGCL